MVAAIQLAIMLGASLGGLLLDRISIGCTFAGVIVPAVRLVAGGAIVDDVFRLILAQIRSKRETPGDLRAHLRYPEDLFRVQTNAFASYHIRTSSEFYGKTDAWDIARNPGSGQVTAAEVTTATGAGGLTVPAVCLLAGILRWRHWRKHPNDIPLFHPALALVAALWLGLWIVRVYIDAMGGSIRVASEPEKGSIFTVELPLEERPTSARAPNQIERS